MVVNLIQEVIIRKSRWFCNDSGKLRTSTVNFYFRTESRDTPMILEVRGAIKAGKKHLSKIRAVLKRRLWDGCLVWRMALPLSRFVQTSQGSFDCRSSNFFENTKLLISPYSSTSCLPSTVSFIKGKEHSILNLLNTFRS